MDTNTATGALQATAAMVLVGSSVAAASLLTEYPIMTGQAGRYALAALLLFAGARVSGTTLPQPTRRDLGWLAAVALVGMAGFNVLLIAATAHAAPSLVGSVIGTAPITLAVLGALQDRRRPTTQLVVAATVVAAGAAVVQQAQLSGDPLGLLLAIGAMLGEVGFSLFAVPALRRIGPVAVSAHACWMTAAMLTVAAVIVEGPSALSVPTPVELAALIHLAIAVTAIAFVLWYSAVGRLGADTAGLFAGLIPVAALLTATAIGTDDIAPAKTAGALLVGGGVLLGLRSSRRHTQRSTNSPDPQRPSRPSTTHRSPT